MAAHPKNNNTEAGHDVRVHTLKSLSSQGLLAVTGNTVIGLTLSFSLENIIPSSPKWWVPILGVFIFGLGRYWASNQLLYTSSEKFNIAHRWNIFFSAAQALSWSIACGFASYDLGSQSSDSYILFSTQAALASASLGTISASRPSFISYVGFMTLPNAVFATIFTGCLSIGIMLTFMFFFLLSQRGRIASDQEQRAQAYIDLEISAKALEQARIEAERAVEAKSRFLASMSHEIRTPMNGVLGVAALLQDTSLNQAQQDLLKILEASGRTLLSLINNVLDFSKIEAGELKLESIPVRVRSVVYEVLALLATRAEDTNIELVNHIDYNVPDVVITDPTRLKQILLNLLGNALKFTEGGTVSVCVFTRNDFLFFEVRDTGIGISEEAQARLFQPFSQADESTTRKFGGTGLGLSIVRRLTQAMGGDIEVESIIGKGSTFRFHTPLKLSDTNYSPRSLNTKVFVSETNTSQRQALEVLIRHVGADIASSEAHAQVVLKRITSVDGPQGAATTTARVIWLATPRLCLEAQRKSPDLEILQLPLDPDRIDSILTPTNNSSHYQVRAPSYIGHAVPLSVLVADDNAVNRMVARRMLERGGHLVDEAENGREALDMVLTTPYALVLMDCQMPEMDGYEATRQIRASQSIYSKTPIVALTAHVLEEERDKCELAGMNGYLSKPISPEQLLAALTRYARENLDTIELTIDSTP